MSCGTATPLILLTSTSNDGPSSDAVAAKPRAARGAGPARRARAWPASVRSMLCWVWGGERRRAVPKREGTKNRVM